MLPLTLTLAPIHNWVDDDVLFFETPTAHPTVARSGHFWLVMIEDETEIPLNPRAHAVRTKLFDSATGFELSPQGLGPVVVERTQDGGTIDLTHPYLSGNAEDFWLASWWIEDPFDSTVHYVNVNGAGAPEVTGLGAVASEEVAEPGVIIAYQKSAIARGGTGLFAFARSQGFFGPGIPGPAVTSPIGFRTIGSGKVGSTTTLLPGRDPSSVAGGPIGLDSVDSGSVVAWNDNNAPVAGSSSPDSIQTAWLPGNVPPGVMLEVARGGDSGLPTDAPGRPDVAILDRPFAGPRGDHAVVWNVKDDTGHPRESLLSVVKPLVPTLSIPTKLGHGDLRAGRPVVQHVWHCQKHLLVIAWDQLFFAGTEQRRVFLDVRDAADPSVSLLVPAGFPTGLDVSFDFVDPNDSDEYSHERPRLDVSPSVGGIHGVLAFEVIDLVDKSQVQVVARSFFVAVPCGI